MAFDGRLRHLPVAGYLGNGQSIFEELVTQLPGVHACPLGLFFGFCRQPPCHACPDRPVPFQGFPCQIASFGHPPFPSLPSIPSLLQAAFGQWPKGFSAPDIRATSTCNQFCLLSPPALELGYRNQGWRRRLQVYLFSSCRVPPLPLLWLLWI